MHREPQQLFTKGRTLNFAGQSRTPGGLLYIDHAHGTLIELFVAVITRTGLHFSLAQISANPNLGAVRIDAPAFGGLPPLVGARFLVGPLEFNPRPHAAHAYPLNGATPSGAVRSSAAQVRRELGTISDVASGYGFIRTDAGGRVFAHVSECERGAQLLVGMRVSFEIRHNPKGPAAHAIQPAAN